MRFDNFSAVDEGFQPFDGGFSNAIGKTTFLTPSPTPPINAVPNCTGHTNSKACMSCAGSSVSGCPQSSGNYAVDWGVSEFAGQQCGCSYNPPLLGGKRPTSFTNTAVKFDGGFANITGIPANLSMNASQTLTQTSIGNSVQGILGWYINLSSVQYASPTPQYPNRKLVMVAQQYSTNAMAFQSSPRLIPQQPNSFLYTLGKNRMINLLSGFTNYVTAFNNSMVNGVPSANGLNYFLSYLAQQNQNLRIVNVPYLSLNVTIPPNIFRYACYFKNN
jgi:hypothetical protein